MTGASAGGPATSSVDSAGAGCAAFFPLPGGGGWYTYRENTSQSQKREKTSKNRRTGLLLLRLLWLCIGIGISELLNLLPLLARLKRRAHGYQKRVDRSADSGLEVLGVQRLLLKVGFERLVGRVVARAAELGVTLDGEDGTGGGVGGDKRSRVVRGRVGGLGALEAELGDGDEHGLDEGEDAVAVDGAFLAEGGLDLPLDGVGAVEQVDLGVGVRARHLATGETGHHLVHEMGALAVAEPGKVELSKGEDLALCVCVGKWTDRQHMRGGGFLLQRQTWSIPPNWKSQSRYCSSSA
jgi:hypothetical protein